MKRRVLLHGTVDCFKCSFIPSRQSYRVLGGILAFGLYLYVAGESIVLVEIGSSFTCNILCVWTNDFSWSWWIGFCSCFIHSWNINPWIIIYMNCYGYASIPCQSSVPNKRDDCANYFLIFYFFLNGIGFLFDFMYQQLLAVTKKLPSWPYYN